MKLSKLYLTLGLVSAAALPLALNASSNTHVPTNLSVSNQAPNRFTISWDSDCDDCTYTLRYTLRRNSTEYVLNRRISSTSKVVRNLIPNSGYYIQVASVDVDGNRSEFSDTLFGKTSPGLVRNLEVLQSDEDTSLVRLKWLVRPFVDEYHIVLYKAADNTVVSDDIVSRRGRYTLTDLEIDTHYYAEVSALHDDVEGPAAKIAFSTTIDETTADEVQTDQAEVEDSNTPDGLSSDEGVWSDSANCFIATEEATNGKCWLDGEGIRHGDVTVANGQFAVTSTNSVGAYYIQDMKLASGLAGKSLLIIAHTKTDTVLKNDITGLPYLYGYLMHGGNLIDTYLNGQATRFNGQAGNWDVSYGVYTIPEKSDEIRYFLDQAHRLGTPVTGDSADFKHVGAFIVDSTTEANAIITEYNSAI